MNRCDASNNVIDMMYDIICHKCCRVVQAAGGQDAVGRQTDAVRELPSYVPGGQTDAVRELPSCGPGGQTDAVRELPSYGPGDNGSAFMSRLLSVPRFTWGNQ